MIRMVQTIKKSWNTVVVPKWKLGYFKGLNSDCQLSFKIEQLQFNTEIGVDLHVGTMTCRYVRDSEAFRALQVPRMQTDNLYAVAHDLWWFLANAEPESFL